LKLLSALLFLSLVACTVGAKNDSVIATLYTSQGNIVADLYWQQAPYTVANFVGLAEGTMPNTVRQDGEGFFDGLTFHRVVPGFVIQGGDPAGNGTG